MKELFSITGNSQKLDGGAMFGNAPKAMWQKWVEVDDENRIDLACRALLVKDSGRNILFELGVGAFFEPKLKQRFGIVEANHVLLDSLTKVGLSHEDIDVLVLSHLHFDHIGGLLSEWQEGKAAELLFPNADILVGKQAWERANNPHARDRASFIPELMELLRNRDKIHLVDSEYSPLLGDGYRFHYSHGHTPGMMLAEITMPDGPIVFCADLIPGEAWVHLPITMGYDRYAELVIDEKADFLSDLMSRNGRLFFTHDSNIAMGRLAKNEKGRFCLQEHFSELVSLNR
ncbi:MBL fold metallo-hydrolase [Aliikangiella sp. IMCC44359]|uniref:MBL fold metallo-hydrolase n=1 Tax=Aliikangiella sp. IMCC44359 TaxID=3459125 RepID=UPI00403B2965